VPRKTLSKEMLIRRYIDKKANADQSTAEISRQLGFSQYLVAKVRHRKMKEEGRRGLQEVKGVEGKTYHTQFAYRPTATDSVNRVIANLKGRQFDRRNKNQMDRLRLLLDELRERFPELLEE
jgi:hypothetical protein